MAEAIKVLGQADPNATTETDLYTVPGSTSTTISSLVVANRDTVARTCRVSVSVGGGATADKDYLLYDVVIPANDTYVLTAGLTLAATDKVRVYASAKKLSFTLFGLETT